MPAMSMGICHIGDGRNGGQSPTMLGDEWRQLIADEIKRQGRDLKEVSLSAGLGETYVRDALKRGRGKLENLIRVASVLGKPPEWITTSSKTKPGTRGAVIPEANASAPVAAPRYGGLMPVLGVAKGGSDGRLIFNGQVIESVPRPAALENVEGAYAVYVSGDSMHPRFKAGEQVWVHPHRPPKRGDDVVVQLYAEDEGDPPEGYIKEFVAWTPSMLILYQHNPAGEFEIDRALVKSVHTVIGSLRI
ncbi:putative phage repressor [Methylobacterium nodulans ORS 2060]|uniref:Putative phage repressor n=2 Tax=Methylobacterium nodulans TaxID=114616 RepID=B8IRJ1_METNO|nr:putative phage repressor [Methylobacterium nodulans ORS 2060]